MHELLWFLSGSTNIRELPVRIWDEWADTDGEVGPIYGFQWRRWGASYDEWLRYLRRGAAARAAAVALGVDYSPYDGPPRFPASQDEWHGGPQGVDQISEALRLIKEDPGSRRIVVSAWNVADLRRMRLPSCHVLFQFYVSGGSLDCQVYQRSADLMLGVPFNVASYALLLEMFARECRLSARYLVHSIGDAHVYANHVEGTRLQLSREVLPSPRLVLPDKRVDEQTFDDVRLEGYQHHPAIRLQVAV